MTASFGVKLDATEMTPPDPLVQSLAALAKLEPGQFLHLVHRCAPALLYPELAEHGFISATDEDQNGLFHVMVWRQLEVDTGVLATTRLKAIVTG